jgi:hypothetical protein
LRKIPCEGRPAIAEPSRQSPDPSRNRKIAQAFQCGRVDLRKESVSGMRAPLPFRRECYRTLSHRRLALSLCRWSHLYRYEYVTDIMNHCDIVALFSMKPAESESGRLCRSLKVPNGPQIVGDWRAKVAPATAGGFTGAVGPTPPDWIGDAGRRRPRLGGAFQFRLSKP